MSKNCCTFAPDLKMTTTVCKNGGIALENPHEKTNLFCTLNKQTNTLEKQSSRGRLFSLSKKAWY